MRKSRDVVEDLSQDEILGRLFRRWQRAKKKKGRVGRKIKNDAGHSLREEMPGFAEFVGVVRRHNRGRPQHDRVTENPKKLRRMYRRILKNETVTIGDVLPHSKDAAGDGRANQEKREVPD